MKTNFLLLLAFALSACQQSTPPESKPVTEKDSWMLFYLGGQSNMEGFGYVDSLPANYTQPLEDVYIFQGNHVPDNAPDGGLGVWTTLKPGFGTGSHSDGKTNSLSNRFGAELSFGHRMKELFPDQKIAIFKYARGGSSIALKSSGYGTWDPDFNEGQNLNQYDHYLTALRTAFAKSDINEDGVPDRLVPFGIAWMQGESDADKSLEVAQAYQQNLKRMMDLIRASLREDDIPVVIGQIADSGMDPEDGKLMDHIEVVQAAQRAFTERDSMAVLVTNTENYRFQEDKWHYATENYIDLGIAFADALESLIKRK